METAIMSFYRELPYVTKLVEDRKMETAAASAAAAATGDDEPSTSCTWSDMRFGQAR